MSRLETLNSLASIIFAPILIVVLMGVTNATSLEDIGGELVFFFILSIILVISLYGLWSLIKTFRKTSSKILKIVSLPSILIFVFIIIWVLTGFLMFLFTPKLP